MRRGLHPTIAAAAAAAAVVALGLPASAAASHDVAITQLESADPVAAGTAVTYTATVANVGTETFDDVGLDLFSLTPGGSGAVNNPYVSAAPTQGSCLISPAGDYQQALCDLGTLAPGASAQVTAVLRANFSMDHVAGLLSCDFGPTSCQASDDDQPADDETRERTTVIIPPVIGGDPKLKLKGLPTGCFDADLRMQARAKVSKVKGIKAKLTGKNVRQRLGSADGGRLTFTIPAADLDQARIYVLNVNATRKGKPGLKREVELQRC